MKQKMKLYEILVCNKSKILGTLIIRTRATKKEVEKCMRLSVCLKNKDIEGFETKDDFE